MEKEEIYRLIKKYARDEVYEITDDMDLFKDLKYDSLCFIEFIAAVEEQIGMEFHDMDALFEKIGNGGCLCEYIMKKAEEFV